MFAAERASASNIARLREYVLRMESTTEPAETLSAYGRVHLELAAAAQSVRLMKEEVHSISSHGWMFAAALNTQENRRQFTRTYGRVIDALQRGDARRARRLTESHAMNLTSAALQAHVIRLRAEGSERHGGHPA
jgi:DNA-binding FadR family transcriptional regulator